MGFNFGLMGGGAKQDLSAPKFSTNSDEIAKMKRRLEASKQEGIKRVGILAAMVIVIITIMIVIRARYETSPGQFNVKEKALPDDYFRDSKDAPWSPRIGSPSGFNKPPVETDSLDIPAAAAEFNLIRDDNVQTEEGLRLATDIEASQLAINRIYNYLRTLEIKGAPATDAPSDALPHNAIQSPAPARGNHAQIAGGYLPTRLGDRFKALNWDDAAYNCGLTGVSLIVIRPLVNAPPPVDKNAPPAVRDWTGDIGVIVPDLAPEDSLTERVNNVNLEMKRIDPLNNTFFTIDGYPLKFDAVFLQRFAYRTSSQEWRTIPIYVSLAAEDANPSLKFESSGAEAGIDPRIAETLVPTAQTSGVVTAPDGATAPAAKPVAPVAQATDEKYWLDNLNGSESFVTATPPVIYDDRTLTQEQRSELAQRFGFVPLTVLTGSEDEFSDFDDKYRGPADFTRVHHPTGGATGLFLLYRFLRSHTPEQINEYQALREASHALPERQKANLDNVINSVNRPIAGDTYRGQPVELDGLLRIVQGPDFWDTNPTNDSGVRTTYRLYCQDLQNRRLAFVIVTNQNFPKILRDAWIAQDMDPTQIDLADLRVIVRCKGLFWRQQVYQNSNNEVVRAPMFVTSRVDFNQPQSESMSGWTYVAIVIFLILLILLIIGVKRESRKAAISALERKQRTISRARKFTNMAPATEGSVSEGDSADTGVPDSSLKEEADGSAKKENADPADGQPPQDGQQ